MERKSITSMIGVVSLGDIQFCESELDVFIGIKSVSEEIQGKIDAAIEMAKAEHVKLQNLGQTDTGIRAGLALHVMVRDGAFAYGIAIDVTDQDGRVVAAMCVEVDLSEYQNELEKAVVIAMIENLF